MDVDGDESRASRRDSKATAHGTLRKRQKTKQTETEANAELTEQEEKTEAGEMERKGWKKEGKQRQQPTRSGRADHDPASSDRARKLGAALLELCEVRSMATIEEILQNVSSNTSDNAAAALVCSFLTTLRSAVELAGQQVTARTPSDATPAPSDYAAILRDSLILALLDDAVGPADCHSGAEDEEDMASLRKGFSSMHMDGAVHTDDYATGEQTRPSPKSTSKAPFYLQQLFQESDYVDIAKLTADLGIVIDATEEFPFESTACVIQLMERLEARGNMVASRAIAHSVDKIMHAFLFITACQEPDRILTAYQSIGTIADPEVVGEYSDWLRLSHLDEHQIKDLIMAALTMREPVEIERQPPYVSMPPVIANAEVPWAADAFFTRNTFYTQAHGEGTDALRHVEDFFEASMTEKQISTMPLLYIDANRNEEHLIQSLEPLYARGLRREVVFFRSHANLKKWKPFEHEGELPQRPAMRVFATADHSSQQGDVVRSVRGTKRARRDFEEDAPGNTLQKGATKGKVKRLKRTDDDGGWSR